MSPTLQIRSGQVGTFWIGTPAPRLLNLDVGQSLIKSKYLDQGDLGHFLRVDEHYSET